jgi:CRISPR-associated protein Cas1
VSKRWGSLQFAANRIKQGQWKSELPEGVYFPILTKEDDPSAGLKKMRSLWKQAIAISKPMQLEKIKNTVYTKISRRRQKHRRDQAQNGELVVTTPGHFIGKRDERIIVRMQQKIVAEIPVIKLSGLTVSSRGVALSGDVIELCMKKEIYIHFVDELGRITAVVSSPGGTAGDISLLQVKEHDSERGLSLARMFVLGKVKNQLALLKYYYKYPVNRKNGFGEEFNERGLQIKHLINKIRYLNLDDNPETFLQQLMGLEGAFAIHYWSLVKHLFNNGILFEGRRREGAKDLVNSALNYGYGILYGRVLNAVIRAGLNPMAGFLHSYQSGKPVLVYDIIEEFRPMIVDRAIFTMFRRGEKLSLEDDALRNPAFECSDF